jgi:16S rRNA (guanine(527)-N(7))-methyltransferase RsmG
VFGANLPVAEEYVRLLAGAGVVQGFLGPREVPRLWSRHILNCAAVAELVPHSAGSHAGVPHSAGSRSAGPHVGVRHSAGSHSAGSHSAGSHSAGSHSAVPDSATPDSATPDSATAHPVTLVDLGSGAGLPGVVLALLLPDVEVTLLERMERRAAFLEECVRVLGLRNAQVRCGRAEDLAGKVAADVVTARAVAPMDRLAGLALGLVRPGGLVLAIKGDGAEGEVARAGPVLRRLGARDVTVLRTGGGKVDRAATVVRMIAGR